MSFFHDQFWNQRERMFNVYTNTDMQIKYFCFVREVTDMTI